MTPGDATLLAGRARRFRIRFERRDARPVEIDVSIATARAVVADIFRQIAADARELAALPDPSTTPEASLQALLTAGFDEVRQRLPTIATPDNQAVLWCIPSSEVIAVAVLDLDMVEGQMPPDPVMGFRPPGEILHGGRR